MYVYYVYTIKQNSYNEINFQKNYQNLGNISKWHFSSFHFLQKFADSLGFRKLGQFLSCTWGQILVLQVLQEPLSLPFKNLQTIRHCDIKSSYLCIILLPCIIIILPIESLVQPCFWGWPREQNLKTLF